MTGPLIPPPSKAGRPREPDMREVSSAIQYMLGTGCQWRAIPRCFPPHTSIQNYFYTWRDSGVSGRMVDALRGLAREQAGRSAEPTAAATGSQPVKTAESGGPAGHDAGKKVKGRKRNVTVDVTGCPLSLAVREASVQDRDGAPEVIRAMPGESRAGIRSVGGRRLPGREARGQAGGDGLRETP